MAPLVAPAMQPDRHDDDRRHERHGREQTERDLRLPDDTCRQPGEEGHEFVAEIRASEDVLRSRPDVPVDHQDLVVPEAVAKVCESRPQEGSSEPNVRDDDGGATRLRPGEPARFCSSRGARRLELQLHPCI